MVGQDKRRYIRRVLIKPGIVDLAPGRKKKYNLI